MNKIAHTIANEDTTMQPKYIHVTGRRWFQKSCGNTCNTAGAAASVNDAASAHSLVRAWSAETASRQVRMFGLFAKAMRANAGILAHKDPVNAAKYTEAGNVFESASWILSQ